MYATYDSMPRKVRFEWIGEAFQLFGAQWGTWVLSVLIYLVIAVVAGGVVGAILGALGVTPPAGGSSFSYGASASGANILFEVIIQIVSLCINGFFLAGLYRMANRAVRGEMISVSDVFSGGNLMVPMLGMILLFYLMILVGALCLLVGIFVVAGLFWPVFAVVADGQGVGNAISRTFDAMKQDWLRSIGFAIVLGLLVLAITILTCGLGTLVAQPIAFLAAALCYRDMIGMPGMTNIPPSGMPYSAAPTPGVWPPPPSQYGQPPYGQQPPAQGQIPYGATPPSEPYNPAPQPPAGEPRADQSPSTGWPAANPPQDNPPADNPNPPTDPPAGS